MFRFVLLAKAAKTLPYAINKVYQYIILLLYLKKINNFVILFIISSALEAALQPYFYKFPKCTFVIKNPEQRFSRGKAFALILMRFILYIDDRNKTNNLRLRVLSHTVLLFIKCIKYILFYELYKKCIKGHFWICSFNTNGFLLHNESASDAPGA